ncbi:MAG: ribose 5-phosphate isomerase B [Armatimonadota bacterium]
MEKIVMAADHAGYHLKEEIKEYLKENGYEVIDVGVNSPTTSVDYPDYVIKAIKVINSGDASRGIITCGTGAGTAIAANKIDGIRAVAAYNTIGAYYAAAHNNANVLTLGERLTTPLVAREIVKTWLNTPFEGGRHERRLNVIKEIEERHDVLIKGK